MTSKRRPKKAAAAPAAEAAAPDKTGLESSPLAVAVVSVLIVCYVVVFYLARDFRPRTLLLLFSPDVLVRNWTTDGELPAGILDRVPILLLAAGILGVAWLTGSLFVRGWKLHRRLSRLETEIFSVGMGLSLWSTWTLAVGLCGLLSQTWLVWLPAVAIGALAGFQMAARRLAIRPERDEAPPRRDRHDWLWPSMLALGLPFAIYYLLAAALPPSHFDVLEYHLQVPKEWFQQGRITFMPHNVYGNMPLGAEMFALLGMTLIPGDDGWWYGALVGKVVMASCSLLTALLLFAAGRRLGSNTAGVVAALVYLSTPWIFVVSVSGYNEGVLAFYFALAAYAVWLWHSEHAYAQFDEKERAGLLKLAGFLAGSAAAVKYTSLVLVLLPLLCAVIVRLRKPFQWRAGVVFLVSAVVACGLWYAKNIALTGNPVYPLLGNVLGGATRTPEKTEQWNAAHRVPPLSEALEEGARLAVTSDWHSPLLLPLMFLSIAAASTPYFNQRTVAERGKEPLHDFPGRPWVELWLYLACIVGGYLVLWFCFTHRLDRFWTPVIPLAALLAGIGATWSRVVAWRHVLVTVLFWGLVSNFLTISYPLDSAANVEERLPLSYVAAELVPLRGAITPPAHRHINRHCPAGYSVLLVGDATPFDLDPPALYNTCFDDVRFDQIFQDRDREERLAALREQKIAYVYVSWGEIERYRSPGNYGFSDYITRELVHQELVREQKLLRQVRVSGLDPAAGELFQVVGAVPRPAE